MLRQAGCMMMVMPAVAFADVIITTSIVVLATAIAGAEVHAHRAIARETHKERRSRPGGQLSREQHSGYKPAGHGRSLSAEGYTYSIESAIVRPVNKETAQNGLSLLQDRAVSSRISQSR